MEKYIKDLVYFIWTLYLIVRYYPGNRRLRFSAKNNKILHIFANGPSLKGVLEKFENIERQDNEDFLMVNFSALTQEFEKVQPQLYCIMDPCFFRPSFATEKVKGFFLKMNQIVTWKMKLFIPAKISEKDFRQFSEISNPNIEVHMICTIEYRGFEKFRYAFFRNGFAGVSFENVSLMAIMIGLNSGYQEIDLYGVEHTFGEGVRIDNENHVIAHDVHYYGINDRPFLKTDGTYFMFHELLYSWSKVFKNHQLCRKYADFLGCNILNCTKNSMIDAYNRKTF